MNVELAAEEIRKGAAIFCALSDVAEMLESLAPLEDAEAMLRARVATAQAAAEAAQREMVKYTGMRDSMKAEFEKGMALMRRQHEELDQAVANQEVYLRKLTDEITRLREMFK